MHKLALLFFTLLNFITSLAAANALPEKSMVIIIPSYNNEDWYAFNLDSVLHQKYKNYRVIYLDDASTDGTGSLVSQYLLENDPEHRVTLIQNIERRGALANIYRGVWMCEPSDIVVTVDGDDWLSNDEVLETLNKVYADPAIWMTYGQHTSFPEGSGFIAKEIPHWVIESNSFRYYDWCATHLRTFYAGLFQKIDKEDLLYEGNFYPSAGDIASTFPMLEMSGSHSRFIPDVLYVYNVATPLSDCKVDRGLQFQLYLQIQGKERYTPLSVSPYEQLD
jgi:glycosyltransferase involved in cell wall biosynthesis